MGTMVWSANLIMLETWDGGLRFCVWRGQIFVASNGGNTCKMAILLNSFMSFSSFHILLLLCSFFIIAHWKVSLHILIKSVAKWHPVLFSPAFLLPSSIIFLLLKCIASLLSALKVSLSLTLSSQQHMFWCRASKNFPSEVDDWKRSWHCASFITIKAWAIGHYNTCNVKL